MEEASIRLSTSANSSLSQNAALANGSSKAQRIMALPLIGLLLLVIAHLSSVIALPHKFNNVLRMTPDTFADITTFNRASASPRFQFQVFDDDFLPILGDAPTLSLILTSANKSFPQFHEAAILASSNPPVLFVSSNQYNFTGINSPDSSHKTVVISRISQDPTTKIWSSETITPTEREVPFANGGTLLPDGNLVFCAQGNLANPGGLVRLSPTAPFATTNLINNYLGIPFNSINDVVRTSDGALWFTDPQFGFIQDIRPAPQLPPQVYRWMPGTTDIRVVADGLVAPNGIAFSPDEKIAYVTDTAQCPPCPTAPRTIYAYDVVTSGSGPLLTNRRTFAMPSVGIPDGITTDQWGNVYSGCGDGVNIWNPQGKLLGKILVPGGTANFALGENGMVFMLNEHKLFLAKLSGIATRTRAKSSSHFRV